MLDELTEEQLASIANEVTKRTNAINERNKKLRLEQCATKRNELYTKFMTDNSTQFDRIEEINAFLNEQVQLMQAEKQKLTDELIRKFQDMAKTCKPYCMELQHDLDQTNITNVVQIKPVTNKFKLCWWDKCEYCNTTIHYDDY